MALGENIHGFDEDKNVANLSNILASIVDIVYPVGSIYMSTTNSAPAVTFANGEKVQWEPWGSGRVPVGVNPNDANFRSSGIEGGSSRSNYKLRPYEVPRHDHRESLHPHTHNIVGIGFGAWDKGETSPGYLKFQGDGNLVVSGSHGSNIDEDVNISMLSQQELDLIKTCDSRHMTWSIGHFNKQRNEYDFTTTIAQNYNLKPGEVVKTYAQYDSDNQQIPVEMSLLQPYVTCYMFKRIENLKP